MSRRSNGTRAIVFASVVIATTVAPSAMAGPDAAAIYEDRCANCHGASAAKLARETLKLDSGRVVLKEDGRALRALLDHHGRQRADEADALTVYLGELLDKPK